ncbi:protease SohB [Candidatus Berkiella cookevillensis]|uniref:Putative protease SohB n=1 Tax=Candidatus Berkiella cookevillensis TaxID=437022 RepID=A0A0Q9YGV5_9GAMM|nr:protease SohB [Candidatus Berkiella cookevillensis]
MIEFLSNYGLFFAKTLTFVLAIIVVLASFISMTQKPRAEDGLLLINNVNEKFQDVKDGVQSEILSKADYKAWQKQEKKREKEENKQEKKSSSKKPRLFVLRFDGDVKASESLGLTECINAIIDTADKNDEVLLILESAGGYVHSYGHAASQVHRIRDHQLKLTIAIDKCAASGGYLMACIANELIASPFAIIGSIGVVGQMPNFHRLLEKNNIDYELHTAGEYKRTLTIFGENTDKQRDKFVEEIEVTHQIFKDYVSKHRPMLDIAEVATGEHWHAMLALEKKLIDKIQTSDAFIMEALKDRQVFEISYQEKQKMSDKFLSKLALQLEKSALTLFTKFNLFKF